MVTAEALREIAETIVSTDTYEGRLLLEAADEIERLRAVVMRGEYEALLADRDSWKRVALHYQSLLGERGLL